MDRPLTVKQAAELLDYQPDHLRRLLRAGTLKGERFSQVWMIDRQDLERIKAFQGAGGSLPKSGPKQ